jgi:hypothetical protein
MDAAYQPFDKDDRQAWAKLAELCTELHLRWYDSDKLDAPRPRLFDFWRPICSSAGMPIQAGVITWHELEVGVSWYDVTVELQVMIPDGTKVTVTGKPGPWNAVARDALVQLQDMAQKLASELPAPKPKKKIGPQQAAARRRLRMAKKLMASHLPEEES